ncbi:MAG: hypothetical protein WBW51_08780 [Methyloceanibacter sp.]
MMRMLLTLACAALLFAIAEARAAEPGAKPAPAATPEAAKGEGTNPEEAKPEATKDEGSKPEDGAPTGESGSPEAQPEGDSGPVSLGELTKDGFVIRTSNFIPADAVTRQSGKVSSDALVVTLQKSTSTAVCFYTLKAYVGKKLNTIPACTVHR